MNEKKENIANELEQVQNKLTNILDDLFDLLNETKNQEEKSSIKCLYDELFDINLKIIDMLFFSGLYNYIKH